jgi:hypothetical protein
MEKNNWRYISMSPAVLKKQNNSSLYRVSVGADPINTQLPTSGTASECYLSSYQMPVWWSNCALYNKLYASKYFVLAGTFFIQTA